MKTLKHRAEPRASLIRKVAQKVVEFFKKSKEIWIGVAMLLVVVGLIYLAAASTLKKVAPDETTNTDTTITVEETKIIRHPLTGVILENELTQLPQVFGVMIENSAEAWPLSGLDKAFLVIEAPVEADIPRFIAFFSQEDTVEKIGPVRSARPYYLDWNDEFDAIYAHCGGSPEALAFIKNQYHTIDLDQFFQSEYFYRQNGTRYAPHNVYTSSEKLNKSLDELELAAPDYEPWQFADDAPVESENAVSLKVDFTLGSTYDVDWKYNAQENNYLRYQGSHIMQLDDDSEVLANNVIVLATDIRVIDKVGRKTLRTVGEGDALIAQNGEVYLAKWRKDTRTGRLRFFTTDGYEISLNAGKTWIEVVGNLSQAKSYK